MKALLLSLGLVVAGITHLPAQSRVSIAPIYWFNYSPYSYQINFTNNGSTMQTPASGYGIVSSIGLMARYHFTPQWDVSVGALYYRNTNHIQSPQGSYGESTPFTSEGWQVPVLVSYRLTSHRLSPIFLQEPFLPRVRPLLDAQSPLMESWVWGWFTELIRVYRCCFNRQPATPSTDQQVILSTHHSI